MKKFVVLRAEHRLNPSTTDNTFYLPSTDADIMEWASTKEQAMNVAAILNRYAPRCKRFGYPSLPRFYAGKVLSVGRGPADWITPYRVLRRLLKAPGLRLPFIHSTDPQLLCRIELLECIAEPNYLVLRDSEDLSSRILVEVIPEPSLTAKTPDRSTKLENNDIAVLENSYYDGEATESTIVASVHDPVEARIIADDMNNHIQPAFGITNPAFRYEIGRVLHITDHTANPWHRTYDTLADILRRLGISTPDPLEYGDETCEWAYDLRLLAQPTFLVSSYYLKTENDGVHFCTVLVKLIRKQTSEQEVAS